MSISKLMSLLFLLWMMTSKPLLLHLGIRSSSLINVLWLLKRNCRNHYNKNVALFLFTSTQTTVKWQSTLNIDTMVLLVIIHFLHCMTLNLGILTPLSIPPDKYSLAWDEWDYHREGTDINNKNIFNKNIVKIHPHYINYIDNCCI